MGMAEKAIKGINILNPVDLDREYYLHAIDYAIENDYNHIQLNGPIHNLVKSNLDGMMFYRKYSRFNDEKASRRICGITNWRYPTDLTPLFRKC